MFVDALMNYTWFISEFMFSQYYVADFYIIRVHCISILFEHIDNFLKDTILNISIFG